jgi:hypothetical protein
LIPYTQGREKKCVKTGDIHQLEHYRNECRRPR